MTQPVDRKETEAPTEERSPTAAATTGVLHRRQYATPEISFVAAPTMTA
jgi:hypothetical protein